MVLTGLVAALEGGLAALAGAGAGCLLEAISFAEGTSVGPVSSPSQSKLSGRVSGATHHVERQLTLREVPTVIRRIRSVLLLESGK
jgi:hypothetical protein